MLQDPFSMATDSNDAQHKQWMIKEGDDHTSEDSTASIVSLSSSSSDLIEASSYGPLYELSELMAQLPIKRGLSKYFEGKSESFTSLSSVRCIEDLAKRVNPYRKKMKMCKSYAVGLNTHKLYSPKATISKKTSRSTCSPLIGKRANFICISGCPIHVQKEF